jgi:fructokinase
MKRFVVCGESLIDLIQAAEQPGGNFSSTWLALSAGGPMNSAVALSRLGADSHFLGRFSRDSFGRQLTSYISEAGVHLDLATESSQSTSIAVVSLDANGVASYTFHFAETANFGWLPEDLPNLSSDDFLHIASLATVVSPGAQVLLDWAGQLTCQMSFDINVRPTVITDPDEYWQLVRPWLRTVGVHHGIVKASDEDVRFLAQAKGASRSGSSDPADVAVGWVESYGVSMAVITLGPDGAVAALASGEVVRVPGIPTNLIDTVGAGDTFMAGFLDGYVNRDQTVADAMRRGAAAASIVCSRQGAQPPTALEVDELLRVVRVG